MTPVQPFPWDESVDDINTPDIDPSFFDNDPFKKFNTQTSLQMDIGLTDDSSELIHPSLEDNLDLSSLINETTPDSQQIVSPNDVLENQYIPSTTTPVLHYLQPRPVESIASTVNLEVIANTSLLDDPSGHSLAQFSSPSHSSYSPAQTYLSPTPSPALSYTSSPSVDVFNSDTNATTDSILESKPEPAFLQPTVINDHLYTLPSKSLSKKRKSSEKSCQREANNMASKKSRVSKKDKQKQMEEQIQHFIADNARCKREISQMERQIQWCKDYLFKKVVQSART